MGITLGLLMFGLSSRREECRICVPTLIRVGSNKVREGGGGEGEAKVNRHERIPKKVVWETLVDIAYSITQSFFYGSF